MWVFSWFFFSFGSSLRDVWIWILLEKLLGLLRLLGCAFIVRLKKGRREVEVEVDGNRVHGVTVSGMESVGS